MQGQVRPQRECALGKCAINVGISAQGCQWGAFSRDDHVGFKEWFKRLLSSWSLIVIRYSCPRVCGHVCSGKRKRRMRKHMAGQWADPIGCWDWEPPKFLGTLEGSAGRKVSHPPRYARTRRPWPVDGYCMSADTYSIRSTYGCNLHSEKKKCQPCAQPLTAPYPI